MKLLKLSLLFCFIVTCSYGQYDSEWFYLRTHDTLTLAFKTAGNDVVYAGNDDALSQVLNKYQIYQFKKTQRNATKDNLHRTYFVRVNSKGFLADILKNGSHVFSSGEIIPDEDKKIYEPNDYGLTSTIGENLGLQVNLDYMDFLGVPKAWYYTTGRQEVIIGISDGAIDVANKEFEGKTKLVQKAPFAKGHGIGVGSYAAAKGNNANGIPGVCFDCGVFTAGFNLSHVEEMAQRGAKIINCSWSAFTYVKKQQEKVNEIFGNGSIIVGSSGNKGWKVTKGLKPYYPASYDNVISVSTVMYKYPNVQDNVKMDAKGNYYAENIWGYLGRTVGFKDNDPSKDHQIWATSTANLNDKVDILAPSVGVFRVSKYEREKTIEYIGDEATSPAAPLVSGTIGLMYSLYPCLPIDEVESILKMTSINIDHVEANRRFRGKYGAGILQTGNAVEMVYQLYNERETAYIRNQDFSRWNFKLTALSKEVRLEDQKFRDSATLEVKAKNSIVIGANTHLKPNHGGSIRLAIDPTIEKQCDLILRDPSIMQD
ncbi:MAG: hypothetical protein Aureis2KO_29840 [Aureisphaera sp.]